MKVKRLTIEKTPSSRAPQGCLPTTGLQGCSCLTSHKRLTKGNTHREEKSTVPIVLQAPWDSGTTSLCFGSQYESSHHCPDDSVCWVLCGVCDYTRNNSRHWCTACSFVPTFSTKPCWGEWAGMARERPYTYTWGLTTVCSPRKLQQEPGCKTQKRKEAYHICHSRHKGR